MTEYIVRQGFVVFVDNEVYTGGDRVELTDSLYRLYKGRLEGSGRASSIEFEVNKPNVTDSTDVSYPAPYVGSVTPNKFLENSSAVFTINGSFFTPDSIVTIDGVSITNVEFVNSHLLIVSCDIGEPGSYNCAIDNGRQSEIENAIEVKSFADSVIDLRSGGTEFGDSAIEIRNDMEWVRDSDGVYFTGRSPFGSWARLVGDDDAWVWNRNEKRSLSIVFKNNNRFMLGIGSRSNNGSSQQYYQAELVGYFSSSNIFDGFYGNTGFPGRGINIPIRKTISASATKKIVFEGNGEPGNWVRIYPLPSDNIADWSDTSNLVGEFTINELFAGSEPEIMPFLIPNSGKSTLFLGLILL